MTERWIELAEDFSLKTRPISSLPEFREMLLETRTHRVQRHFRKASRPGAVRVNTTEEKVAKNIVAWLVMALDAKPEDKNYWRQLLPDVQRYKGPNHRILFTVKDGFSDEAAIIIWPERIMARLPHLVPPPKF